MKCCVACLEKKPLSSFFPSKCTPDGLADRCKPCCVAAWQKQSADRDARLAALSGARNVKPRLVKRRAQRTSPQLLQAMTGRSVGRDA